MELEQEYLHCPFDHLINIRPFLLNELFDVVYNFLQERFPLKQINAGLPLAHNVSVQGYYRHLNLRILIKHRFLSVHE